MPKNHLHLHFEMLSVGVACTTKTSLCCSRDQRHLCSLRQRRGTF